MSTMSPTFNGSRVPLPIQIIGREFPGVSDIERERRVREVTSAYRTKRGWECPVCGETDGQCIAYAPETTPTRVHVWCIRGEGRDGAQHLPGWGFRKDRGGAWYFEWDEARGAARN